MVVCILNGYPRAGKDTFCDIAGEKYKVIVHSTVDKVKGILKSMGWNGKKTPEIRKALSDLKDMYTELFDGPFIDAWKFIDNNKGYDIIFIMCREPKEIARLNYWCNGKGIPCYTLLIDRGTLSTDITNHADRNVEDYKYDIYIDNTGSLNQFKEKVLNIIKNLLEDINA